MEKLEAIERLNRFSALLVMHDVRDAESFRVWRKAHAQEMAECFDYVQRDGMPPITSLVGASFHPELPLIMFNYTSAAHNLLHVFPEGWTRPLRLCRGIIFDRSGQFVALPFEKFFNYGEHPETRELLDEPFTATEKHDGHLGIIFMYRGRLILTTRGSFTSPSAKLGSEMLARTIAQGQFSRYPEAQTTLVEIIHPKTRVHINYRTRRGEFILIGATNRHTLDDYSYEALCRVGEALGIAVTTRWQRGTTIAEIRRIVGDVRLEGSEGCVVRFASGLRVKFKFAWYINQMVEAKLSHKYIMQRMISGNLERMIENLDEEVYGRAQEMIRALKRVRRMRGTLKERRVYLYGLVPLKESTSYYRAVCRKFLAHIDAT